MKKISLFSIFMLSLLLSSCFVKVPSRGDTDFSENYPPTEATTFTYIETTADILRPIITKKDSCIVTIFAPWCPYSYSAITRNNYYINNKGVDLIFVCTNYDIPSIEKHFKNHLPTDTIFLIDADKYSTEESLKTKRFLSTLLNASIDSVSGGVPQHILLKKGKIIQQHPNLNSVLRN